MLPVTSALPPLIAQSHDELHRPDQKLERLSLNPDMPMLTPVEVEYAPAAPATWHHSQRGREATRDNTRERAAVPPSKLASAYDWQASWALLRSCSVSAATSLSSSARVLRTTPTTWSYLWQREQGRGVASGGSSTRKLERSEGRTSSRR